MLMESGIIFKPLNIIPPLLMSSPTKAKYWQVWKDKISIETFDFEDELMIKYAEDKMPS